MLQIRLIRDSAAEVGGGGGAKPSAVETVTVACPDHLVLADLPVAKGLGITPSSSVVKSVGRRSRRVPCERVHFCVQCDFPIAIYGRLSPCDHVFCLECARSDSSCYLCDERIQRIQTIKMLEEIYICAAPHCFKSFLKRTEFMAHIHDNHADLLQPNAEKEEGNETDGFNITRPSSADPNAKQPALPDQSTARSQPRPSFSPNSNSQSLEREDKARHHQLREQPPLKQPPLQPKLPPFYHRNPHQPTEPLLENNPPQGLDRPYNRFQHNSNFDGQGGVHYRRDSEQFPDKQPGIPPEPPFGEYPPLHLHQPPSFPPNVNQGPNPPPQFSYPPFPTEGSQMFYNPHYEIPRPEMMSDGGSEQGSLLGFPPAPAGVAGFPDSYPRPWGVGFPNIPFEPLTTSQGIPDGHANLPDSQARTTFFQGDYGRFPVAMPMNSPPMGKEGLDLQGGTVDHKDSKGVLAPAPLPPPPPLPLPMSQLKRGKFSGSGDAGREGQGYGWQNEKRGFGSGQD
ncbi:E3 ubiquitin-protein ligase Hakai [Cinnamomum micranthum f. kanehirae]|uniref:RING-type E3 ubiquitin transferase n=1 Tax=Cinnamomum micranthum f. kanehirae TaxID=337451 RepID=A0A443PHW4_9MAGN|nr:E3 ubiquitin-protein ligase Hakai [Cinnamomum micranthum f. kanehirae]